MEIPSRNFYRYLLLCGNDGPSIAASFDHSLLLMPPRPEVYFEEQVQWAYELLGTHRATVPTALRRAGLYDMWAAHKQKKSGKVCKAAFHIASLMSIREPLEALLLAGWPDYDISRAISASVCHNVKLSAEEVNAYRRYFFDPSILSAQDRGFLIMRSKHLRVALLALRADTLLFAVGLRYSTAKDRAERAYNEAWQTWLTHLEMMPLRTDREGLKSLSTFLSTIKTLDRDDPAKDLDDIPLVQIVRGAHKELEEGF